MSTVHRMPVSLPQRASILPAGNRPSTSTTSASSAKTRHLNHLHSQLAQLSANLSDLENLVRMTAVQAESMRGLGGWSGALFMAVSREFEPDENGTYGAAAASTAQAGGSPEKAVQEDGRQ